MTKTRVRIWPCDGGWKWAVEVWITEEQAEDIYPGWGEGWADAHWSVSHSLGELDAFHGRDRSEEKARRSARRCLADVAGRLALKEFDAQLKLDRGYTVEVGA